MYEESGLLAKERLRVLAREAKRREHATLCTRDLICYWTTKLVAKSLLGPVAYNPIILPASGFPHIFYTGTKVVLINKVVLGHRKKSDGNKPYFWA